jgi:hypothetical protein
MQEEAGWIGPLRSRMTFQLEQDIDLVEERKRKFAQPEHSKDHAK